jgi:hypothetical protein
MEHVLIIHTPHAASPAGSPRCATSILNECLALNIPDCMMQVLTSAGLHLRVLYQNQDEPAAGAFVSMRDNAPCSTLHDNVATPEVAHRRHSSFPHAEHRNLRHSMQGAGHRHAVSAACLLNDGLRLDRTSKTTLLHTSVLLQVSWHRQDVL